MYRDLLKLSRRQVALKYGLDRYYKNEDSMISLIARISNEIRENPSKFGISEELVKDIEKAKEERNGVVNRKGGGLQEIPDVVHPDLANVKDLAEMNSRKSAILLNRKLDMLLKKKKELKNVSITALAQVYGITFDKRQIAKGEATEHIALRAKVDVNVSTEEKLRILLGFRDGAS